MTPRARLALAVMALVALVAFVYAPVRNGVFVWDDHSLVETSRVVQEGSVSEIFARPFWTATSLSDVRPSYYRPLTMLTLRGDYALAGTEAPSFHVSNLLMHLLATIALVVAARRFGASPAASLIAAGAWALHPRSTEAVAWISGRADVIAGLLSIVAVASWPWYADAAANAGDRARPTTSTSDRARAALAGVAVLLGLLAKEVAIAAAIAIVAGTVCGTRERGPERWRRAARRLLYVAVPLGVYAALRSIAMHGTSSRLTPLGFAGRSALVVEAVGRYLEMTFDPWHPASSIGLVGEVDRGNVVLGVIALAFSAALVARAVGRRRRAGSVAPAFTPRARPGMASMTAIVALGLTSIALVLHVVPIALGSGVVADRLLYLPLAALALALAVACTGLSARARTVAGAMGVALAATFVPVTRARAADYTDELVYRLVAAEQAHPSNTSPKSALGNMLRADTEVALACRLHASVRRTLERDGHTTTPRYIRALENLGGCYAAHGDYAEAEGAYLQIVRLEPSHARVHMELGYLRVHTYELDRAEVELERALELDPKLAPARATLAALPELRGLVARFATDEARRADPLGHARLLTDLGRIPDATRAWSALLADPNVDAGRGWQGVEHLLDHADLPAARAAAEVAVARGMFASQLATKRLAARVETRARIDALRSRIEALADGESTAPSVTRASP